VVTTEALQVMLSKCNCCGIPAGSAAAVAAGMAAFALGSDWNGSLRIPVSVICFYTSAWVG
jgi:hypothetical protein